MIFLSIAVFWNDGRQYTWQYILAHLESVLFWILIQRCQQIISKVCNCALQTAKTSQYKFVRSLSHKNAQKNCDPIFHCTAGLKSYSLSVSITFHNFLQFKNDSNTSTVLFQFPYQMWPTKDNISYRLKRCGTASISKYSRTSKSFQISCWAGF